MEVIVTSDRKLVEITYLGNLQPTYIGVIIYLLAWTSQYIPFKNTPTRGGLNS